ncbi:MAG: PhzF family phenazine biosynthesis protein [Tissierellia bacterium]|nr:PhzF family phenazine biosynthesis protein [Tissierellia bacterium]
MTKKIYQVDAFTDQPFAGNPAGVVPQAQGLREEDMALIAREMNLSETAFVFPGGEGYDFEVRFFTPTEEVDLCGHATIGTFSLLRDLGLLDPGKKDWVQKTRAGLLSLRFLEDGTVLMEQAPGKKVPKDLDPTRLAQALGLEEEDLGLKGYLDQAEVWSTGLEDMMVPLASVDLLKNMQVDMEALAAYSRDLDLVGAHVFSVDEDGEIWTRNLAPAVGIPEEAATGTSNGALGACLFNQGLATDGVLSFVARQGDWMGRPSRIQVQVKGQEVWVGGKAVKVLEGEIDI